MPYKDKETKEVIPMDKPFTHRGVKYPANFLRLASEEDRQARGIIWELH